MSYTIRVSLMGTNALESAPDVRNYSLLADDDNVLIKEHSRGTKSVGAYSAGIAEHSLGYFPHFYAYAEKSSGRYQLVNGYNIYSEFRAEVDTTNLYLYNAGSSTKIMRFFIFYDDIPT